jgi:hypothetical protein
VVRADRLVVDTSKLGSATLAPLRARPVSASLCPWPRRGQIREGHTAPHVRRPRRGATSRFGVHRVIPLGAAQPDREPATPAPRRDGLKLNCRSDASERAATALGDATSSLRRHSRGYSRPTARMRSSWTFAAPMLVQRNPTPSALRSTLLADVRRCSRERPSHLERLGSVPSGCSVRIFWVIGNFRV